MLNIAICDDDIQIAGQMEMMIQNIAKRNYVDTDIEVFWNGKSLADTVASGDSFDIIFLDIEMDKEDGISAAKRIRIYDKNVLIIYVTSHENHMKESFTVRPFRFLVKPVNENQILRMPTKTYAVKIFTSVSVTSVSTIRCSSGISYILRVISGKCML